MKLIISDNHAGLKKARQAVLPGTPWQRCYFHLAQNAQRYATSKEMKGKISSVIRDIYQAPNKEEAKGRLKRAVHEYEKKAPRFSEWMEENCEEGLIFYEYPEEHWKKIRTNNASEKLNQEIKRRTSILLPIKRSHLFTEFFKLLTEKRRTL